MFKRIKLKSCIFVLVFVGLFHAFIDGILILNMENQKEQPPNMFRSCSDARNWSSVSRGLDSLRISGSAQFSEQGLLAIIRKIDLEEQLILIDLREESHGFINGAAVSSYTDRNWENMGCPPDDVELVEKSYLETLMRTPRVVAYRVEEKDLEGEIAKVESIDIEIASVQSERELAEGLNIGYVRLPITDHLSPSALQVDRLVSLVRSLPADAWLHFHCKGGKGRTTTFMAMYDMMHNAKKVSFDEILLRQHLIGGSDMTKLPIETHWKYPYAVERLEFLQQFYEYCLSNTDGYRTLWSHAQKQ